MAEAAPIAPKRPRPSFSTQFSAALPAAAAAPPTPMARSSERVPSTAPQLESAVRRKLNRVKAQ